VKHPLPSLLFLLDLNPGVGRTWAACEGLDGDASTRYRQPMSTPSPAPAVDVFIQVRMTSSRLPGKALAMLGSDPCIHHVVRNCLQATRARNVVLCTSTEPSDAPLVDLAKELNVEAFTGSLDNCIERFSACAQAFDTDIIVRVCGDSPLVDPECIDAAVDTLVSGDLDYVVVTGLPVGAFVEVFTRSALLRAKVAAVDPSRSDDLSHFLRRTEINRVGEAEAPAALRAPHHVVALNRPEDFEVLKEIFDQADPSGHRRPTLRDAIAYLDAHPACAAKNREYTPSPTKCDIRLDPSQVPSDLAARWP